MFSRSGGGGGGGARSGGFASYPNGLLIVRGTLKAISAEFQHPRKCGKAGVSAGPSAEVVRCCWGGTVVGGSEWICSVLFKDRGGVSVSELKESCWSDDITVFFHVVEVGKLIRKSYRGAFFLLNMSVIVLQLVFLDK